MYRDLSIVVLTTWTPPHSSRGVRISSLAREMFRQLCRLRRQYNAVFSSHFESLVFHHLVGLRISSSPCPYFCSDFSVSISSFLALNTTKLRGMSNNPRQNCVHHGYVTQIERIEISIRYELTCLQLYLFL